MGDIRFISAEHETTMMLSYPKLWKQIVKKFGHHPNFSFDGISRRNSRRVGGKRKQSNRRVLKYGRRKGYHG